MTRFERGPSEQPPTTRVADDEVSAVALVEAVARGDVSALLALFDRTVATVRPVLASLAPGADGQDEVLAASYLEVWWLAGCRTRDDVDVAEWITSIARRRAAEFLSGSAPGAEPQRPSHAQREFAVLFSRPVSGLPE